MKRVVVSVRRELRQGTSLGVPGSKGSAKASIVFIAPEMRNTAHITDPPKEENGSREGVLSSLYEITLSANTVHNIRLRLNFHHMVEIKGDILVLHDGVRVRVSSRR